MKAAVIAASLALVCFILAGASFFHWPYLLGIGVGIVVERLGRYAERVLFPAEHEQGHR